MLEEHVSVQDITEQQQRSEGLFRGVFEAAPDAMVIVDSQGKITLFNEQTQRMFGYGPGELAGRPIETLIPERFRNRHEHQLAGYMAHPQVRLMNSGLDLTGIHKDGHEFPVEISLSPLNTDHGSFVSAAIRDVTERSIAQRELSETAEQLRHTNDNLVQSEQKIRHFVTMAAHELRTPLTSIAGFSTTINERWDTLAEADKRRFIEIIEAQADRLSRLVNDLLTLSRIEDTVYAAGREVSFARANVLDAIKQTIVDLNQPDVKIDCAQDLDAAVEPDHVQQVLVNFIVNAFKYGAEPVEVEVAATRDWITITVSDNGEGVPEDFAPRLFEKFTQAHSSVGSDGQGTGLGLSIVEGIAIAYAGQAWYEPNSPTGARFNIRLPRAQPDKPED